MTSDIDVSFVSADEMVALAASVARFEIGLVEIGSSVVGCRLVGWFVSATCNTRIVIITSITSTATLTFTIITYISPLSPFLPLPLPLNYYYYCRHYYHYDGGEPS